MNRAVGRVRRMSFLGNIVRYAVEIAPGGPHHRRRPEYRQPPYRRGRAGDASRGPWPTAWCWWADMMPSGWATLRLLIVPAFALLGVLFVVPLVWFFIGVLSRGRAPARSIERGVAVLYVACGRDGADHDELDLPAGHRRHAARRLSDRLLSGEQHGAGASRSCCSASSFRTSRASSCAPTPGWSCSAATASSTRRLQSAGLIDAPLPAALQQDRRPDRHDLRADALHGPDALRRHARHRSEPRSRGPRARREPRLRVLAKSTSR